jgi:hypothetical protein
VRRIYGKVFKDDLNYMKNYKSRWLFGVDDTGDITRLPNINNIATRCKQNNIMLITGDAGLGTEDVDILILEKLELAQMLLVITALSKGGCCIIKNFALSTSSTKYDDIQRNLNYSISIVNCYMMFFNKVELIKPTTSNPLSTEYYLIGIDFKGAASSAINDLHKLYESITKPDPLLIAVKSDNQIDKITAFFNTILSEATRLTNIRNLLIICDNMQKVQNKTDYMNKLSMICPKFIMQNLLYEKSLYNEWMRINKYKPPMHNKTLRRRTLKKQKSKLRR